MKIKRITLEVDEKAHAIIKKHVIDKGLSIKEWVLSALTEKLNKEKNGIES